MIEALACGTPVIAWRNGSVPEVIDDGVTGFVVDSVDEAVEAVERIAGLSRHACRSAFEAALRRRAHGPGLRGGVPAAGAWCAGPHGAARQFRPHAMRAVQKFSRATRLCWASCRVSEKDDQKPATRSPA